MCVFGNTKIKRIREMEYVKANEIKKRVTRFEITIQQAEPNNILRIWKMGVDWYENWCVGGSGCKNTWINAIREELLVMVCPSVEGCSSTIVVRIHQHQPHYIKLYLSSLLLASPRSLRDINYLMLHSNIHLFTLHTYIWVHIFLYNCRLISLSYQMCNTVFDDDDYNDDHGGGDDDDIMAALMMMTTTVVVVMWINWF